MKYKYLLLFLIQNIKEILIQVNLKAGIKVIRSKCFLFIIYLSVDSVNFE
jgi:hypothetical protein